MILADRKGCQCKETKWAIAPYLSGVQIASREGVGEAGEVQALGASS